MHALHKPLTLFKHAVRGIIVSRVKFTENKNVCTNWLEILFRQRRKEQNRLLSSVERSAS